MGSWKAWKALPVRDYGVVSPQFWIGQTGKALRGNVEAQVVALYLMTSPHATMTGVFYCPVDYIAKETGLGMEGASKGLRSLEEAHFCQFDPSTEEVFVSRMAAFQIGEQLDIKDNRCKGVARELEKVSSALLKTAFRALYSIAFHLPEVAAKAPADGGKKEAPPKPLRSQEQEQEQEQDQEQDQDHSAKAGGKPPKLTDPKEIIFGYGLSLLVNAGTPEKQARSFLGGLEKHHGPERLVDTLRECAKAKPLQPLEWLAAALPPPGSAKSGKHAGFASKNYREGISDDGSFN
jgi:hypothetical protein